MLERETLKWFKPAKGQFQTGRAKAPADIPQEFRFRLHPRHPKAIPRPRAGDVKQMALRLIDFE